MPVSIPTAGSRPARRRRDDLAAAVVCVIAVGVASRLAARHLPGVLGKDLGDALWATMFYLGVVLLWPGTGAAGAVLLAMGVASAIECLKLYHTPWMDALRADRFAGFLLGHTFLWRDFVSYALGAAAGAVGDRLLIRLKRQET